MEELVRSRSSGGQKSTRGYDQPFGTKFKLTQEAVTAKEHLAEYWDVTQEEVAGMAAQLAVSFLEEEDEETRRWFVEKASDRSGRMTRKSHAVSGETKAFLEETANELDLTRDQFFDGALRLAHSIVKYLRETQLDRHREELPRLRSLLAEVESFESELQTEVSNIDPLKSALSTIRKYVESIVNDIEGELERGEPLARDHEFD